MTEDRINELEGILTEIPALNIKNIEQEKNIATWICRTIKTSLHLYVRNPTRRGDRKGD